MPSTRGHRFKDRVRGGSEGSHRTTSGRKSEQVGLDPVGSRGLALHRLSAPVMVWQRFVEQLRKSREELVKRRNVGASVDQVANDAHPELGQCLMIFLRLAVLSREVSNAARNHTRGGF